MELNKDINIINVIKHDGTSEPLDITKATDSLKWAIGDLKNVSVSDIEMQSKLHFYDGIKTSYITDVFIKTTYDMSSIRDINYDAVCKNLKLQKLYKNIFKGIVPFTLMDFIKGKEHLYNKTIYNYTQDELDFLDSNIVHERDFNFTASGLDAVLEGYGYLDITGEPIETPQFIYILIAMDAFHDSEEDVKMQDILDLYEGLSTFKVTLPTPEMKSFRTPRENYASCCTVRIGCSVDSWNEGSSAIVSHTVADAGVGVSILDIASAGDIVSNGRIKHLGKIPIIKSIDTDINKSTQNGRRGSGTVFVNFFDPEIEDILAIKSPRTALDKRVNDLSYGVCLHQLVYDRAKANDVITLLSTRQASEIVSKHTSKNPQDFIEYYEKMEAKYPDAPKIQAQEFFKVVGTERFENSAYYIVNIDEVNSNTPYKEDIVQSNICVEFLTPTKTLSKFKPNSPAIGICVLANINQSLVDIDELEHYTNLLVKLQSRAALRQVHPTSQANAFVNFYRDIGIGFSNHANWLAKHSWRYGNKEALNAHSIWMEHFSYGLIKASMELAKKYGKAPGFDLTNWVDTMPWGRAKQAAKDLISDRANLDWEWLIEQVKINGMFNCGLGMVPPAESSSIPSNQTSALEPIRELLTIKDKKGKNHKQYAPDALKLADKYDYAYDRKITRDFLKHVAVTQIWIDKSISAGVFYNPELYPDEKVRIDEIISDMFYAKDLGIKTLYYQNTKVKDGESEVDRGGCGGGGCSV